MPPPKFVIGNIAYDDMLPQEEVEELIPFMKELGLRQADASPRWPIQSPGKLEPMLGMMLQVMGPNYLLDSRVESKGNGDGTMTADAIAKSLDGTLAATGYPKVNVYYCDRPDYQTPITEQAAAIDKEYRAGRFTLFGVCNFPVSLLEEWLAVCEKHGYVKPKVFQGQYNLLCRSYEESHFPLLRKHGIRFFAHSPIAGGFLTGKVTFATDPVQLKDSRWERSSSNGWGNAYLGCYDKPAMHDAVRTMDKACKEHGLELFDAAVRWMFYHSALVGGPMLREEGDAVIVGSHTLPMLRSYADVYLAGPLPEELVQALDVLWEGVKADANPNLQWGDVA